MKSRDISFSVDALEQLQTWQKENAKVAKKILELAIECTRTPFVGTGKPEGLKHEFKGYWSRRITDGDRLIYRVDEDKIYILSCEGHYNDK